MANRCFYYVEDDAVKCEGIDIAWDCGFTPEAKQLYIDRIISRVPDKYQPCYDVTTASPYEIARSCSPHILTMQDGTKFDEIYQYKPQPVIHDLLYCKSLSKAQKSFIMKAGSFTDVFHDPYKKGNNTQAHSLAVVKLLLEQEHEAYIDEPTLFAEWYKDMLQRSGMYAV